MKKHLVAAALAATLAVPAVAQTTRPDPGGPAAPAARAARAMTHVEYLRMAASGDMFEIESSRLALQRSRDPRVRRVAARMIRDHNRSSEQLMALSTAAGTPGQPMGGPELMPEHAAMLRELQQLQGRDFDRGYWRAQMMAHQQAYQLHSGYAQAGDVPQLRQAAGRIAVVVRQHMNMVRRLSQT